MTLNITATPTPGRFYRATSNDTWLGLVGRAYGVGPGSRRLALSKMANNHPNNWRLHRPPKNKFERTHYPKGLVSLSRRFPSAEADYERPAHRKLRRGGSRPIIYIPPEDDVWLLPPPEVVQKTGVMCWAAAMSSLSRARRLNRRFGSQTGLARVAHRRLEIPAASGGTISIIIPSPDPGGNDHGLRIVPNVADAATTTRRGETSARMLAGFMGLTIEPFFGDAGPGTLQQGLDTQIDIADIAFFLREFGEPFLFFRDRGPTPAPGIRGHVSVVFGASETDNVYFEMDPARFGTSGPVFGRRRTRILRSGSDVGTSPAGDPSQEIFILL